MRIRPLRLHSLYTLLLHFSLLTTSLAQVATDDALPLSLEACFRMADENNLALQHKRWDKRERYLQWQQTKTDWLPNINMGANGNSYHGRSINPATNTFINRDNTSLQLNLRGSMELFNGFRKLLRIRQAETDWRVSRHDMESERISVFLRVLNGYLDSLLRADFLRTSEQQLGVLKTRQEVLERQRKIGSVSEYEVAKGRAELSDKRAQWTQQEGILKNSERNLCMLLRVPYPTTLVLEGYEEADVANAIDNLSTVEEIYETAHAENPSIKSNRLREKSAALGVKIAKRRLYPTLSLVSRVSSSYASANDRPLPITAGMQEITSPIGFLDSNPQERVSRRVVIPRVVRIDPSYTALEQLEDNIAYSVGLSLTVPVFNRWELRRNIRYQMIARERTKINMQRAVNQLRDTIEAAHNDIQASIRSREAAQDAHEAARIAYDLATLRHGLGEITLTDYQEEENQYYTNKLRLLQERYTLLFRIKIMDFYTGAWKAKYNL